VDFIVFENNKPFVIDEFRLELTLSLEGHAALNRRTVETTRRLLPEGDRVVVYCQQYFAFFTLLEHMELTLSLEEKARQRAGQSARVAPGCIGHSRRSRRISLGVRPRICRFGVSRVLPRPAWV
jgi:hypothetical protein